MASTIYKEILFGQTHYYLTVGFDILTVSFFWDKRGKGSCF